MLKMFGYFLDVRRQAGYLLDEEKLVAEKGHSFVFKAADNQIAEEIPGGREEDGSAEGRLWYLGDCGLPVVWTRQRNETVSWPVHGICWFYDNFVSNMKVGC